MECARQEGQHLDRLIEKGTDVSVTQDLGAFVARVGIEGTPQEARSVAKTGFADCIATMVAGSREAAVTTLQDALAPFSPGRAQLWFGESRVAASDAALLNGVAAHALDFDDVALRGHPSAVLVPAIVAAGQEIGSSGAQMLDAYVAGYEVWANLVDRESDIHHIKGWHPTGIFGAIGAAAACAALRRLTPEQCSHALGLGASQSAGLMSNFGSMAKPFHAGRAAQAGVLSARLAGAGFTASADALEHPQGFLVAVSPKGAVDRERPVGPLGQTWQIVGRRMNIKKYPTCYYTHRALDGMLDLLAHAPIDPRDVERVDVTMSQEHATVLRNHRPVSALEAKFSIEFAMAGALVARKLGLVELDDAFVQSEAVQRLYQRVHVTISTTYDPDTPGAAFADEVAVTTTDGRRHTIGPVHQARGHAQVPLTMADLRAKFVDCLQYGRFEGDAVAFFDRINAMEQMAGPGLATA
jgi:2-methylcitrate dehydratase PrpD